MFLSRLFKRKSRIIKLVDVASELNDPEDDDQVDDDQVDEDDEELDPEEMQEQVYQWGREWSQTPGFEALTLEQKNEAEGILANFTRYMYDYHDVTPEEWDIAEMEDCCLDTLPRKISAEEGYFRAIAPVLASFFTFLHKSSRLPNGVAMARRIRLLENRIVAASNDPRYWGPAKSFVMAAMRRGVDVTDNAQMESFMGTYNAEIMSQTASVPDRYLIEEEWDTEEESPQPITYMREGPKVGRNDPCPCGSGKKFKKCCGSA